MRFVHLILFLFVASCGYVPTDKMGADDPLIYDRSRIESADKIALFIPGALSSVNIFDASVGWEDAGYARAFYRYPGLDGMAVDHYIDPPTAAAHVAQFANRYPDKDIVMVGYSTGGLIALEAAPQITKGRAVRIAAMSTAVENGGAPSTIIRGARDVLRAINGTQSLRRADVWKWYWSGLLYGPEAVTDPDQAAAVADMVAKGEKIYVKLDPQIALAHMLALPGWELPNNLDLSDVEVAFFVGLNDPVFSTEQTSAFARRIGGVKIYGYPGQGHLLFFTRPDVFDHMLKFADGRDPLE